MGSKDRLYPHDRLSKIKAGPLMEDDDVKWMVEWIEQLQSASNTTTKESTLYKQIEEQKAQITMFKAMFTSDSCKL